MDTKIYMRIGEAGYLEVPEPLLMYNVYQFALMA